VPASESKNIVEELKKKTCTVFLSSLRNMSGSLAEEEVLWEHESTGECFYSFFEFSKTVTRLTVSKAR